MVVGRKAGGKAPGGKKPDCHSFHPDTPVVMADGTTKKIKDVKVGDKVLATDPRTGKTYGRTVTYLHINQDTQLAQVTVRTADGRTVTLHTTQNHPFWDTTGHQWVNAAELQAGHRLRDVNGKAPVTVLAVEVFPGLREMRDLTVAIDHTYYVMAGSTPVLVHNCTDLPLGFRDKDHYNQFVNTMNDGLANAGHGSATVQFRGSSVTGRKYTTGRPFGSHSDYDIDVIGQDIFDKARQSGANVHTFDGGMRTGELTEGQLDSLGLLPMKRQLDEIAGRPVNFVVFPNMASAIARGPGTRPATPCNC